MFEVVHRIESAGDILEDRVAIDRDESDVMVVLADGAGGMSGGADAADVAANAARAQLRTVGFNSDSFVEMLSRLDKDLSDNRGTGETTIIAIRISASKLVGASVGDSGAWLISDEGIDDLSSGQVRKPLLGSGATNPVGFERTGLTGRLLVASDGLFKYASRGKIADIVRTNEAGVALDLLMALVRYPSGALPDDVSLVLVKML
ncbi:SpoIIE family protein phosphatase [bacterium]|nr:SpoIIE family protein phosphatase [bacterium]